jgi:hypothetical protein
MRKWVAGKGRFSYDRSSMADTFDYDVFLSHSGSVPVSGLCCGSYPPGQAANRLDPDDAYSDGTASANHERDTLHAPGQTLPGVRYFRSRWER